MICAIPCSRPILPDIPILYPHEPSGKHRFCEVFRGKICTLRIFFILKGIESEDIVRTFEQDHPKAPTYLMFYVVTIIEKSLRYNC